MLKKKKAGNIQTFTWISPGEHWTKPTRVSTDFLGNASNIAYLKYCIFKSF